MKLSVVTIVRNCDQYLKQSLDSLKQQTFQEFELIFVNDASEDKTKEILLEYADDKTRILENQYNEGIAVSRNRGLLAAQGEYVAIHDGDDISLPHRFQKQIDFLDKHQKIGFIGSHAIKMDRRGNDIGFMVYPPERTIRGFYYIMRYKLNPILDPSCMYRRNTVLKFGGYSMRYRYSSDFDLWCRMMCGGVELSNILEPLIKYRVHGNNTTKTAHEQMREETDDIIARFKRRNFPHVVLDPEDFNQDSFTEDLTIKNHNKLV